MKTNILLNLYPSFPKLTEWLHRSMLSNALSVLQIQAFNHLDFSIIFANFHLFIA